MLETGVGERQALGLVLLPRLARARRRFRQRPLAPGIRHVDRAHHRDPWNIDILFIPSHVFTYAVPLQVALWIGLAPTLPLAFTGLATSYLLERK